MNIWKLNPQNIEDTSWEASTHRSIVIVRAETEKAARMLTANKFAIATSPKLGEQVRTSPWRQQSLVSAVCINDSEYSKDGEARVLEP